MDRLTAIRIKYKDQTFSPDIPVGILAQNVEYNSNYTLIDVIGDNIDVDNRGSLQDQIRRLENEKIDSFQLQNYVSERINLIIIDESLSINHAAADAQAVGSEINLLKSILNFNKQVPPGYVLRSTDDGYGVKWDTPTIESPALLTIDSSAGNIFRGRTVNTILTARVTRGPKDITQNCIRFVWEKYDREGKLDQFWTRETVAPTIFITQNDIQNKATFKCKAYYWQEV